MTEEAIDLMLKKLAKMSADPLEQNAILEQSIREGWTGIYELKEHRGNKGGAQTAEERWANIH